MPPARRPQARETLLRAGTFAVGGGGAVSEFNTVFINQLISGWDRRLKARYLEMTAVCAAVAEKRTVLHS